MSDFDDFDDSDHLPPDHLINELESIKGVLDSNDDDADSAALPTDIPLLDTPLLDNRVIDDLDVNARLLNLNRIFESEEDSEEDHEVEPVAPLPPIAPRADIPFPRFRLDTMLADDTAELDTPIKPASSPAAKNPSATARVRPDYSRDVLIQELVDEFVPQIEAALRERLSQLDNAALQQWKDRD